MEHLNLSDAALTRLKSGLANLAQGVAGILDSANLLPSQREALLEAAQARFASIEVYPTQPKTRPAIKACKRPGQQLPAPRQSKSSREDEVHFPDVADTGAAPDRTHGQKMEQQDTDWANSRDQMRKFAVQHLPLREHIKLRRQLGRQLELDELLAGAWRFHECESVSHCQRNHELDGFECMQPRAAAYYSVDHRFNIRVPQWKCKCCGVVFEPHPQAVGCWPSTAARPARFYDTELLELFSYLTLRHGLSATGTFRSRQTSPAGRRHPRSNTSMTCQHNTD